MSQRTPRVERNEELFRIVRAGIAEVAGHLRSEIDVICECAKAGCPEKLDVPLNVYERVRGNPGWFIVMPGHASLEFEHILERHGTYDIVQSRVADTPVTGSAWSVKKRENRS